MNGPGFLGAHLNLHDRPKENDYARRVSVIDSETLDTETIRMAWPTLDLNAGDSVEISILDEGEGDGPSEIKHSSEAPDNLFFEPELARKLLALVSDFEGDLTHLGDESKASEAEAEHKKFEKAVGRVAVELGDSFLYPIYRRHPNLVPEGLKGELL